MRIMGVQLRPAQNRNTLIISPIGNFSKKNTNVAKAIDIENGGSGGKRFIDTREREIIR